LFPHRGLVLIHGNLCTTTQPQHKHGAKRMTQRDQNDCTFSISVLCH
jgi:hypothetical protein